MSSLLKRLSPKTLHSLSHLLQRRPPPPPLPSLSRTPPPLSNLGAVRFFAAPVSVKKAQEKEVKGTRTNEEITALYVRLVTDEGHSIVTRREALHRAKTLELDLVEINCKAEPPVCKIMDFHKEKYKKEARDKEHAKAKSETSVRNKECKEVHFTGKIEKKDLEMKADTVKRLMERGYRVKVVAEAGKKADTPDGEKQDLGAVLQRLYTLIEDISAVESAPRVEKRLAYMIVRHAKFGTKKNPAKKALKAVDANPDDVQVDATETSCSSKPTVEFTHATTAGVKNSDILSHSKEALKVKADDPKSNPSSRLNTTERNQRHRGYSPAVGTTNSNLDRSDQKDRYVPRGYSPAADAVKGNLDRSNQVEKPVPSDSTSAKPSPVLSNRYQRGGTSSQANGARTPPRPYFDRSRNNYPSHPEQHQSHLNNSNAQGRVPYQIPPDRNNQNRGHADLKQQPLSSQGSRVGTSSFGVFKAPEATPSVDPEFSDSSRDKGKSPLKNNGNLPKLKTENPKQESTAKREYGLFSR